MLPLIFTLALDTAMPATPADGTYNYVSAMNGATIGKTSITVTHDGSGMQLSETGGGSFNGQSGTVTSTLSLDAATLAPSAYSAAANLGDGPKKATLSFKGDAATQTGDAGERSYALAANAKHFVVLDLGPFSGWFALPAQMTAWNDSPAFAIVPTMEHAFALAPSPAASGARPKNVPSADVAIGVTAPVAFTEWYDPKTLVVDEVDVPTQGLTVTRRP